MNYPCHAPGCEKESLVTIAPDDTPWVFEFCSRACWNTVPLLDHLRAEGDRLNAIAADRIEHLEQEVADLRFGQKNDDRDYRAVRAELTAARALADATWHTLDRLEVPYFVSQEMRNAIVAAVKTTRPWEGK